MNNLDMPYGAYIAKGRQYRIWIEDEDGNFPDGLDAYDAATIPQAIQKLKEHMQEVGYVATSPLT